MEKILLVCGHPIFASGLKHLLEPIRDRVMVEEAGTWQAGMGMLKKSTYRLLAINTPPLENELLLKVISCHPSMPVLVFSENTDLPGFKKLYQTGVSGILEPQASLPEIFTAIKLLLEGKLYLGEKFKRYLIENHGLSSGGSPNRLSRREMQVAELILQGKRLVEICRLLRLRPSTVSSFKSKICAKMGVSNVMELSNTYLKHGPMV